MQIRKIQKIVASIALTINLVLTLFGGCKPDCVNVHKNLT